MDRDDERVPGRVRDSFVSVAWAAFLSSVRVLSFIYSYIKKLIELFTYSIVILHLQ